MSSCIEAKILAMPSLINMVTLLVPIKFGSKLVLTKHDHLSSSPKKFVVFFTVQIMYLLYPTLSPAPYMEYHNLAFPKFVIIVHSLILKAAD